MVLPIEKAAAFLDEIKAGMPKWNGVIDPGIEQRVKAITNRALEGNWGGAANMVATALLKSSDPALYMLSGILNICMDADATATRRLRQTLSMDPDNNRAAFLLYLINADVDQQPGSANLRKVLDLDWRSSDEFFGYLARIREARVDRQEALASGWDNRDERAWIELVVGQLEREAGHLPAAEAHFKSAVLMADIEKWSYLLARGFLFQVQQSRLTAMPDEAAKRVYQEEMEAFKKIIDAHTEDVRNVNAEMNKLVERLSGKSGDISSQRHILEQMRSFDEENGDLLVGLAFYSAMDEAWEPALTYSRDFLKRSGRESASRLSVGLLEPEILLWMGRTKEMQIRLKAFHERTRDPWYRALSAHLIKMGNANTSDGGLLGDLTPAAGQTPENLVTAHSALGFWSESQAHTEAAKRHYREALGSYLDNWLEYELARERLRRLKNNQ
jgi:hypothetical protein